MQYDKLVKMTEQNIPNELKWNYFLHHWALISASPFKNVCAFSTAEAAVSSVTVSPSEAELYPAQSLQLDATITGTGFFDKDVVWSISGNTSANTKISRSGIITLAPDEQGTSHQITVTATSVADSTKSGSATILVTQPIGG